jgi:hypothetical protein
VGQRRNSPATAAYSSRVHRRRPGLYALGVLSLVAGGGWRYLLGLWLVGVGVNYVPLTVQALALSRPGALEEELRGLDVRRELRRAGVHQFWIAVPFAVAIAALLDTHSDRGSAPD